MAEKWQEQPINVSVSLVSYLFVLLLVNHELNYIWKHLVTLCESFSRNILSRDAIPIVRTSLKPVDNQKMTESNSKWREKLIKFLR